MYFYNILEPRFICDKAIKVLKHEKTRLSSEIGKLKAENSFEDNFKIRKLQELYFEYEQLIEQLNQLGDFGTQQMQHIVENKEQKGNCIF